MDSPNTGTRSQKLIDLAHQLRLFNPQPVSNSESPTLTDPIRTETTTTIKPRNRAAVLICIFEGEGGDLRVILTKRSSTLSSHSGQVALPGGKTEEGDDSDADTALREAKEEIGLDPSLVDVVAVLDPFVNKRGMAIVPVIGILSNKEAFHPVPNPSEVEAIFDVPLEMFLKNENRREEEKEWQGKKYLLHYFDYEAGSDKFVIWAITAGFLITAASIVYKRPPAFSERKPHFWQAN